MKRGPFKSVAVIQSRVVVHMHAQRIDADAAVVIDDGTSAAGQIVQLVGQAVVAVGQNALDGAEFELDWGWYPRQT